ncbi:MAG: D-Ala-D-Ala carboxypeptidase family metallohydrolase [Pseudomonadota bacterium]
MFKLATALATMLGLLVGFFSHSFVTENAAMSAAPTFSTQPEIIQPERYIGHPENIKGWVAVYFDPSEFASPGNGQINIDADLVNSLDAVRAEFGQPIRITSGYRDPKHNRRVGGAPASKHMEGIAADIDMTGMDYQTRYRLMTLLIQNGFRAFGTYDKHPNMLHADRREFATTWHYGPKGHPGWFIEALQDTGWKRGNEPFAVATAVEQFEYVTASFAAAPAQVRDMSSNHENDTEPHTEGRRTFALEGTFDAETNEHALESSLSFQDDHRSANFGLTIAHDRDPKFTAGIELNF